MRLSAYVPCHFGGGRFKLIRIAIYYPYFFGFYIVFFEGICYNIEYYTNEKRYGNVL